MALEGVNQGLAGFAQFGQQQLKNKGQRILNEGAQMDLNTKQANQNLALMETFGVVKLNEDTARYELTDNFYEAYQKIPEGERGAIFNGDSLFGAYTDKDGKKKMGELGSAIAVEKKVPTSMKDENGDPTEEGKQFLASGQKGIIIPTKREDGMFSFLTRNRSADESDDEGIVLSPAEFGGLMEFRANKLNVLSDANRARAGNLVSQQAENLQGQGMGSSDTTVDDQLDMLYNQVDSDENIAGTGGQTDVLGGLLEQWKNKIGEKRLSILNAQTQNAAPRQGQIGIDFKNEKAEFFKQINADKVNRDTPLTLLKNTGDFKTLLPSLTAVIDGNFDSKDGNAYPTKTALYNFWKSKEGNEGSSRLSKDWQAVQNDPTQLAELASEYLPAVKQQLSDAGYDLKYLEDFVSGDAKDVTAPVTDVEFPEYPDLSNITTKEGALELLASGKMDNILTPDLIAEAQKKLTDEGVTDAGSFKKAVKEQRIKNPYAYATIMAMYMAPAGSASATETAVQRNEILNLLATDDPSQTKKGLVAQQESIANTRATIAKNLSEAGKARREEIKAERTELRKNLDTALLSISNTGEKAKDGNIAGDYKVAITSLLGVIDLYEDIGTMTNTPIDGARALQAVDKPTFIKAKELISSAADTEVKDTNWPFSFEFWGDLAFRSSDKDSLFKLNFDNLAVIRDSKTRAEKIVAIQTDGTYRIEADQSTPAFNLQETLSPEVYNILLRILPDVSDSGKFNQEAQDKKAGA
jgi:hypothetical protein